jgi:hypothetical protein
VRTRTDEPIKREGTEETVALTAMVLNGLIPMCYLWDNRETGSSME